MRRLLYMRDFFRRSFSILAAIMMIFGSLTVSRAEEFPFSGFATDNVRLRESASSGGKVLLMVPKGDAVYVIGEKSGYYIVQYEGKQGYILKSYVSLESPITVAVPTQVPSSYQAQENYETLYTNLSGAKVRALQQALAELGFYSGVIDADYGVGTKKAVSEFQNMNGLTVNGAADAATQELLYEGTVKNSKGKKTNVRTLPPISGWEMRLNDKGDAVVTLKARLQELQYYTATAGDVFDALTQAALIQFQKKNGMKADGVAGEKTQNVLYSQNALAKNQTATPAVSATPTPKATAVAATYPYETTTNAAVILRLKADTSSSRVTTIPKNAKVEVLAVSGEYLKVSYKNSTGYVVAVYVDVPAQYRSEEETDYQTLKNGDSGEAVKALQQALNELNFYLGDVNGVFNTATIAAVKAFQNKNSYAVTGVMTPTQQKALFEGRVKNNAGKTVTVKTLPAIENYPMAQGDKGDAVSKLQAALKSLGYYTGTVNGVYDSLTAKAVKAFQKAKGLTADGKAGDKTQKIIFALTSTPTPVPAYIVTTAPTATPLTDSNVIVMQNGTRGVAVLSLQARLVELGYYSITPDGIYNSDDISAVRAFQNKNGLKADGIAGLETQQILFSAGAIPYMTATPTLTPSKTAVTGAPTATPDLTTLLKTGSKGVSVTRLQERLIELNYFSAGADGLYGTATAMAVRLFQRQNGLTADGVAGVQTLKAIYSSNAKKYDKATATTQPTATPKPTETVLQLGDSGSEVKAAQQRLVTLGYMKMADGSFGPATYAAVVSFQQRNALTVNGELNAATIKKLNSASAKSASAVVAATPTPTPSKDTTFVAPNASEVRYANWYTEVRTRARAMPLVTIYDPDTGLHYQLRMFSFGKHADAEPPTAQDTAIMNQVCGENNWTPHAVWVIFSDGRVYMASTHSHGHTVDHTANNNLTGHVCLHFPRLMEEAEATGPYAVSHQNAILLGWELTQAMIR